jgi:hypothetical protein
LTDRSIAWITSLASLVGGACGAIACFLTWSTLAGVPNYYPDHDGAEINLFELHSWTSSIGSVIGPWLLMAGAACLLFAGVVGMPTTPSGLSSRTVAFLALSGAILIATVWRGPASPSPSSRQGSGCWAQWHRWSGGRGRSSGPAKGCQTPARAEAVLLPAE